MRKYIIERVKHLVGRCAEEGCWKKGLECQLPDNGSTPPAVEFWCNEHARAAGFCRACGQFFAGVTSFDFSRSGLCEECDHSLRADLGEFDEDEEAIGDEWYP